MQVAGSESMFCLLLVCKDLDVICTVLNQLRLSTHPPEMIKLLKFYTGNKKIAPKHQFVEISVNRVSAQLA